jgi:hypothetical protein
VERLGPISFFPFETSNFTFCWVRADLGTEEGEGGNVAAGGNMNGLSEHGSSGGEYIFCGGGEVENIDTYFLGATEVILDFLPGTN